MRLLADENIPRSLVAALRERFDVVWGQEIFQRESDASLVSRALAEGRVILTMDADFGTLYFREGVRPFCGVIYVRARKLPPEVILTAVPGIVFEREDWAEFFSVITLSTGRIRRWPLHRA